MHRKLIYIVTAVLFLTIANNANSQNNRDLFFVFLNSNPDKEVISEEKVEELQAAHMDNIGKLSKEGKLIAAGPFDGGGGMFILRADNLDQANEYLSTDPAIAANRFIIEVFPFNIYNGNLCGATEPYEMVSYQFIRISVDNDATDDELGKVRYDTRFFMSELQYESKNLIVHGKFGNQLDGMLILNVPDKDTVDNIMQTNPSVAAGLITYDVSTIWIAKGTFCEE